MKRLQTLLSISICAATHRVTEEPCGEVGASVASCLVGKRVAFVGDSHARNLFRLGMMNRVRHVIKRMFDPRRLVRWRLMTWRALCIWPYASVHCAPLGVVFYAPTGRIRFRKYFRANCSDVVAIAGKQYIWTAWGGAAMELEAGVNTRPLLSLSRFHY
jgi:hypothetical protein